MAECRIQHNNNYLCFSEAVAVAVVDAVDYYVIIMSRKKFCSCYFKLTLKLRALPSERAASALT